MFLLDFQPEKYGARVGQLLAKAELPPLGPGIERSDLKTELMQISADDFSGKILEGPAFQCCLSGLWLLFNFLDRSHTISQDIHTKDGSFWHAIMHRREPDAWNSKYWWRKVGQHPVLSELGRHCTSIGYDYTTPENFVDFAERHRDTGSQEEELARQVQLLEWQLLFDYCYE